MSATIVGRTLKRASKDLGRVLAIARLSGDETRDWLDSWQRNLQIQFPRHWRELATRTGNGLRALLESEQDLDEAAWANNNGLLASHPATAEQLKFTARRLLQDVVGPFERGDRRT